MNEVILNYVMKGQFYKKELLENDYDIIVTFHGKNNGGPQHGHVISDTVL